VQVTFGGVADAHQSVIDFAPRDTERGRGDEKGLAVHVDAGEAFGIAQLSFSHAHQWAPPDPVDFCAVGVEHEFEQG
jgi:hypothetical protein